MPLRKRLCVGTRGSIDINSLLVSFGLDGFLVLCLVGLGFQVSQSTRLARQNYELEELRNVIRLRLNCDKTAAARPTPCPAGAALSVHDNFAEFIPTAGGKLNLFTVRALCLDDTQFQIEVLDSFPDAPGWTPLFRRIPLSC